jgi:hypothetical protein
MAAKTYSEETLETFHNVRVGGPKEKRLRKVELMGEHQPKPIFYLKVAQKPGSELDYIKTDKLISEFSRYLFYFILHASIYRKIFSFMIILE